ncbi:MAG: hypothetical protein ACRD1X_07125 [Vicinamibacteria bacterium]
MTRADWAKRHSPAGFSLDPIGSVQSGAGHRAQPVELDEEVPRQSCFKHNASARRGMLEGERGGVQKKVGVRKGIPARDEVPM